MKLVIFFIAALTTQPQAEPAGWRFRVEPSDPWTLCELETAPTKPFAFEWQYVYAPTAPTEPTP